jgi:hypothetical protein
VLTYEPGSAEEVRIENISWALTAAYILLPDTFLTLNLIHIKQRLIDSGEPKELTVSERVKKAKK